MTMARYAQRPKAEPADGLIALRWDERRKRWDATFSDRQGRVLWAGFSENRVPVDASVAPALGRALIGELDSLLPF